MVFGSLIKMLVKGAVKLGAIFVASFVPSLIVCQVLRLNPWINPSITSLALLLSGLAFAVGWVVFFKSHNMEYAKYAMIVAVLIPPALLVISLIGLMQFLSPAVAYTLLFLIVVAIVILWYIIGWLKDTSKTSSRIRLPQILEISSGQDNLVGAIEVQEIPDSFIGNRESSLEPEKVARSTLNVIRAMVTAGIPYALRVERNTGNIKFVFLTHATTLKSLDNQLDHLQNVIRAYYPGFLTQRTGLVKPSQLHPEKQYVSAQITGAPLSIDTPGQSLEGLTSTVETLLSLRDGMIQVFVSPASSNSYKRWSLRKEFEKEQEKSHTTVARSMSSMFASEHSVTQTQVDVLSSTKAQKLRRELSRHESENPCNVGIYITCWDGSSKIAEQNTRMLVQSLVGSFTPSDHTVGLKHKILHSNRDSEKLVNGHPLSKMTFLLIEEASVFFIPPRNEMGLKTSKRESFSTATRTIDEPLVIDEGFQYTLSQTEMVVKKRPPIGDDRFWKVPRKEFAIIGRILDRMGNTLEQKFSLIWPDEYQSHMTITGTTRTGKTTAAIAATAQLTRLGVYPVVFAPVKPVEWYKLKTLFNEYWIFTAGNPGISPLRINFWIPPEGVLLSKWVESLSKAFHALLPNDEVITMHFKVVLYTLYEMCGWDVENNAIGRPILLPDLVNAVLKVGRELKYGDEVKANFIGALISRVIAILHNASLVDMYNTKQGVSFSELLDNPTIIDMENLPEEDARFLAAILTTGFTEYRLANPLPNVFNVLVLEEAHFLLKKPIVPASGTKTTQHVVVETISNMFRVTGGIGLPVIISEQLPCTLADEVIKLPSNMIAHAQHDAENEQLVGTIARCDAAQTRHIAGMKKGEAIVYLEKDAIAKNVQVIPLEQLLTVPLPTWTRERVRDTMLTVHEEKSEIWQSEHLSIEEVKELISSAEEVKETLELGTKGDVIEELVQLPEFKRLYLKYFENVGTAGYLPIVRLISSLVSRIEIDDAAKSSAFKKTAEYSRRAHDLPKDDNVFEGLLSTIEEVLA